LGPDHEKLLLRFVDDNQRICYNVKKSTKTCAKVHHHIFHSPEKGANPRETGKDTISHNEGKAEESVPECGQEPL
jgi:hypothetical protein